MSAIKQEKPTRHLVSIDEKSGIQALQRIHEGQAMKKGKCRRIEAEYERKGTICLIAAIDVGKGNIINGKLNDTRNELDFLLFVQQTASKYPQEDEVIFMADQLNTHKSESLVKWIAKEIKFEGDLGEKARKGILKSMESRKHFLENQEHRIRFVFTPKHCSWLNPIENWFAKLQRHVINNGNFNSIQDLGNKIENYIEYYNECLVKPLKWKFKGFTKNSEIICLRT